MEGLLLGIDIGTSACKAAISPDGRCVLAQANEAYRSITRARLGGAGTGGMVAGGLPRAAVRCAAAAQTRRACSPWA
jgi:hypothetical protein